MPAISEAVMSILNSLGTISGILILVGLALIVLEIFLPGFGFPGITGSILLLASIFFTADTLLEVSIMLVFFLVIIGIALWIVIRLGKAGRLSKGIILDKRHEEDSEEIKIDDLNYFIGKKGVTISTLRPSGKIDLDGVKLDAVAEGSFISNNKEIVVVKVDGIRIVVREIN